MRNPTIATTIAVTAAVKTYAKHGKARTIKAVQQSTGVNHAAAEEAVEAIHRTLSRQVLAP